MAHKVMWCAGLAMAALTGCSGETDPRKANVFDNIHNLNSGEYDRQVAAKEAEAQRIINANARSQRNIDQLRRTQASNASTIAALRSEIAAVRGEISGAKAKLAGNAAATRQLNQLSSQLTAVQNDVSRGGDAGVARSELKRIRAAVRALSS